MLLTTPVPHAEAARLIRGKLPATRKLFDAMAPELQAAAVVITGVEDLHAIERVRNLVAEIPEGGDWELAKDQIITELMPWLQDDEAAANRAELILRSHGYAAYAKANYAALEDQIEIFPWRKYQTAQDERVRGTHAALDGVIAPANSPFWRAHTPPWDFGCRCDIVGLTDEDVKGLRGSNLRTAEGKPALKIIDPGPELDALEQGNLYRDGVMNFVARNPDGFKFDPEGGLVTLEMLKGLKKRVGAKIWDGFAAWARNASVPGSGNAWDYLTKPVRKRKVVSPVPTLAPAVAAPIAPIAPVAAPVSGGSLAAHRAAHPSVAKAFPRSGSKAADPIQKALAAIESVHGDGALPDIKIRTIRDNAKGGVMGQFTRVAKKAPDGTLYDWKAKDIAIRMTDSTRELTAAHEIGHFIASFGLGTGQDAILLGHRDRGSLIGKFWEAATRSKSYQAIPSGPWDREHTKYLQKPEEVFARAYSQFIAKRGKGPEADLMRAQVRKILDSPRRKVWHWEDDDFAAIDTALEAIFNDKGWMRPA
jgi:SPP1 gp7 family putative phage head morphogenesis protein